MRFRDSIFHFYNIKNFKNEICVIRECICRAAPSFPKHNPYEFSLTLLKIKINFPKKNKVAT
jgi:hypothetical protein